MKEKNTRVDWNFKKELDDIKIKRIKNGLDRELQSDRRLTKELTRFNPDWNNLKNKLLNIRLERDTSPRGRRPSLNKKGQSFLDIFVFMGILFFMIIIFGVLFWFGTTLYTSVRGAVAGSDTSMVNLTQITDDTLGGFADSMKALRLISFVIIFGMIFLILLSNFLVKENPIYFMFYILATVIGVITSVFISNAYQNFISSAGEIAPYVTSMKEGNFVILYLPYFVTVIGIFGIIFLLIGILRDTGSGGGGGFE